MSQFDQFAAGHQAAFSPMAGRHTLRQPGWLVKGSGFGFQTKISTSPFLLAGKPLRRLVMFGHSFSWPRDGDKD